RSHVSIATAGLVLVLPVIAGVIAGGYPGGLAGVIAGFLVYDFAFIPPYYTLTVGAAQNWVALAVYVLVMLSVAQVVARFQRARSEAQQRALETQRLFDLSEMLVEERSVSELLETMVSALRTVFGLAGAAVLLPAEGQLEVVASSGEPMTAEERHQLQPDSGLPVPVGTTPGGGTGIRAVALSAAGRPIGILALKALPESSADRDLLQIFANHAALALERAQLRAQVLRSEMLEAVDQVRRDLLGAVSHDLRTPLATMKVASSTLLDPDVDLSEADRHELYDLLDVQTDRLTRLVSSLLEMTRYQAGVLKVDKAPSSVLDLIGDAIAAVRPSLAERRVDIDVPDGIPPVDVDPLLIGQVLVNLLDNADRHGPLGTPILVSAALAGDEVRLAVADRGPGVPLPEREAVFESFVQFDTGGRSGLGLAIAKTFLEAHGERIWIEGPPEGGARLVFTLPVAAMADGRER
ncbi:MAG TPA: ATP-binding protein, partial [Acidimicrobiales bacterium]|nr:ATP-binding protein [Acidimicrobiales bacterium]